MKLDVNVLRYMSQEEFRVLTAVEMGQKNHQIVPVQLVESIAGLRHGGTFKLIRNLLRHRLLHHENTRYDGYRLTPLGYDYLALRALLQRGSIASVGRQIGVGKESDIYEVANDDGEIMVLKLHRLGRTSFRAVKSKRDYLQNRTSFSWLYLSRLSAVKEFAFMKALGDNGFTVPKAIETNRHAVLMSMCDGFPMTQIRKLLNPGVVYKHLMRVLVKLAQHGLVHCDFNEFNLIVNDEERVTMIDFPQMVSTSHANAADLFERDVECVRRFFRRRYEYRAEDDADIEPGWPKFEDAAGDAHAIDQELKASGFSAKMQVDLERFVEAAAEEGEDGSGDDDGDEDDDEDETEEEEEDEGEAEEVSGADGGWGGVVEGVDLAALATALPPRQGGEADGGSSKGKDDGGSGGPAAASAAAAAEEGGAGSSSDDGEGGGAGGRAGGAGTDGGSRMTGYTIGSVTSEDVRRRVMDARRKKGAQQRGGGHQNYSKARSSKKGNRGGGGKSGGGKADAASFGGW